MIVKLFVAFVTLSAVSCDVNVNNNNNIHDADTFRVIQELKVKLILHIFRPVIKLENLLKQQDLATFKRITVLE